MPSPLSKPYTVILEHVGVFWKVQYIGMIILASKSPRRRQLMAEAGYIFVVHPAGDDVEDGIRPSESPYTYVQRLAVQKAAAVADDVQNEYCSPETVKVSSTAVLILACDTVVVCEGEILGQPKDIDDARRMHRLMNGTEQRVLSGVCTLELPSGRQQTAVEVTRLAMRFRSDEEIEEYLATDQWRGKAGGFGYQDRVDWLHVLEGSETNIVGLPMETVASLLR